MTSNSLSRSRSIAVFVLVLIIFRHFPQISHLTISSDMVYAFLLRLKRSRCTLAASLASLTLVMRRRWLSVIGACGFFKMFR